MRLWPIALLLATLGCSSSSSATPDAASPYSCPETIDALRAAASNYYVDYSTDFATLSATCKAGVETTAQRCDGPYDTVSWYSFPDCGEKLFYDHTTGALVAVLGVMNQGGDQCGGNFCVAGPAQFYPPGANCTTVASCPP